ncbi:helicase-exonuclease AddAB subunit AddA [Vagococcus zengguangii]|uniref:ATP-dependent helicase/nuclease subunit A n=1 Tax=Vagococcus zengguangii TaxID=2571750 RepID=A0A4D7CW40_9ENTE|nr:helicase-exonuclease AddAB subunit AddA [Vagococcus zengguangii]QCI86226.1 helicase-exonuclease AddAB subunit AddA [Vagococcus zengguangii]TLG79889.1 helicase-exonuclease AddAB subunit AddA [Vagococcus zengguangii]
MTDTQLPIRPSDSHFTTGQWQAIYDSGSNILVSASAGSGKTTVLVQRVIEKIKSGLNIDELLIVTYTEAAAKEMKERLVSAVQKAIHEENHDASQQQHLINQLSKIPTAPVSTLHAFCLKVIRKYYYLLEIDPVFRLLTDETEVTLLKEEVWEGLREQLYSQAPEWFYPLTENFSGDRNDDGLTRMVFSLYEFSRANPNPNQWLDDLENLYETTDNLGDLPLYQTYLKANLVSEFVDAINRGREAITSIEGEPALEKPLTLLREENAWLEQLYELLLADQLEDVYQLLQSISYKTYSGPRGKDIDPAIKEAFEGTKAYRNQNKELVVNLTKGLFATAPSEQLEILAKSKEYVHHLAVITKQFAQKYLERKQEKNSLDFNDLEHLTLQILTEKDPSDGTYGPSVASDYYRGQFKEVLVDEYQDINQLQETILSWLRSDNEAQGNFFMVGDVKQSIYSFRLADPTLFIKKYNDYATEKGGRRIVLAENFRSRAEVLSFTNFIFRQVMNESVGQLAYDNEARLINGFTGFPSSPNYQTELLIYENGVANDEDTVMSENETTTQEDTSIESDDFTIDDKTEGEVRLIVKKIRELQSNGFQVYDKKAKQLRALDYRDIVILTPTKKNNLVLLDLFKELGVPLHVNDTQNYFQATEVKIMLAVLTIIDNPHQDIPLVSVLRSPIVGLKENDLAVIRTTVPNGNYYHAVQTIVKEQELEVDQGLRETLIRFEESLTKWRETARRVKLVDLIWMVFQETGLLDYVAGLPSGKQRQANLHALYDRAMKYEESSFKGLFQFVRFIEKMQQKDKDLAEPNAVGEEENAVRVMTIHASKGLEFPVVFIMDLNRQFNMMDLRNRYVFDEKLGIGVKYLDSLTRLESVTLPYHIISQEKRKKLLAEEMRKLYVGLTRAEEKLFLVGSYESQEKAWKRWVLAADNTLETINDNLRLQAKSLFDWIGMSLVRHESLKEQVSEQTDEVTTLFNDEDARFSVSFYDLNTLQSEAASSEVVTDVNDLPQVVTEPELIEAAKELLDYRYQHQAALKTASYQSVSEIKRVFSDPDDRQLLPIDFTASQRMGANRFVESEFVKPKFVQTVNQVSYAEIGTATHLVLQSLDLTGTITEESINQVIDQLIVNKALEVEVAKRINRANLVAFFQTPFGEFLHQHAQQTYREQPFSMLLPASEIYQEFPENQDDHVLIHGIIDGYVETDDELILFDFKTDYIDVHQKQVAIEKLKQKYQGQLYLYKKALEAEKKRPVTSVKLVLLATQDVVDS